MWAPQRPLKFKVLQSGSEWEWEKKKTGQDSKKTLWFGDWLCQRGVLSLFWRECLESWGEMWITAPERKKSAKVCWGRSLWHHHGSFSGSTALRLQRGDFFIYLSDFMPCRPQNGPNPCPVPPLWLAVPILFPKTLNGDIVFSLLLFFSCIRRDREFEPGDLRTHTEKSGSVILFKGCFSRCGNCSKLKGGSHGWLEELWQLFKRVLDVRALVRYLNWVIWPSIGTECWWCCVQSVKWPSFIRIMSSLVSLWGSWLNKRILNSQEDDW